MRPARHLVPGIKAPPIGLGACLFAAVACAAAAATYAGATRIGARHKPAASPAAVASPAAQAPSAAEFALLFVDLANRYARANGDPVRLGNADCVQASAGHYMCSYASRRPGGRPGCHIMQARWTPRAASSFTVTLAGRSLRCGSLREALRSLR